MKEQNRGRLTQLPKHYSSQNTTSDNRFLETTARVVARGLGGNDKKTHILLGGGSVSALINEGKVLLVLDWQLMICTINQPQTWRDKHTQTLWIQVHNFINSLPQNSSQTLRFIHDSLYGEKHLINITTETIRLFLPSWEPEGRTSQTAAAVSPHK